MWPIADLVAFTKKSLMENFFFVEWLVRNGIATAPTFFFFPAGIYLLKVNNGNTRTRCDIAG